MLMARRNIFRLAASFERASRDALHRRKHNRQRKPDNQLRPQNRALIPSITRCICVHQHAFRPGRFGYCPLAGLTPGTTCPAPTTTCVLPVIRSSTSTFGINLHPGAVEAVDGGGTTGTCTSARISRL